jgi:hypothetical protein
MNRGSFIKSFVGLVGVAASIQELSLINTPIVVHLSPNARIGDLVMSIKNEIFYFDGKRLISVDGSVTNINAVVGTKPNDNFILFANACRER